MPIYGSQQRLDVNVIASTYNSQQTPRVALACEDTQAGLLPVHWIQAPYSDTGVIRRGNYDGRIYR